MASYKSTTDRKSMEMNAANPGVGLYAVHDHLSIGV